MSDTPLWFNVACPTCAAQPNTRCIDAVASLADFAHPVYLAAPHAERVEAGEFVASIDAPGTDRNPLTAAAILATGEV